MFCAHFRHKPVFIVKKEAHIINAQQSLGIRTGLKLKFTQSYFTQLYLVLRVSQISLLLRQAPHA